MHWFACEICTVGDAEITNDYYCVVGFLSVSSPCVWTGFIKVLLSLPAIIQNDAGRGIFEYIIINSLPKILNEGCWVTCTTIMLWWLQWRTFYSWSEVGRKKRINNMFLYWHAHKDNIICIYYNINPLLSKQYIINWEIGRSGDELWKQAADGRSVKWFCLADITKTFPVILRKMIRHLKVCSLQDVKDHQLFVYVFQLHICRSTPMIEWSNIVFHDSTAITSIPERSYEVPQLLAPA